MLQGDDRMKRRSKTKYTQIHVSIPVRLLEDFDQTLDFKQSRSKMISSLIDTYLSDGGFVGEAYSSRRLMAILSQRDDVDDTMKALLLQLLFPKGE